MKRKAKGLICIAILGSMLAGCGNKEVSTTASDMKSGAVELTYCVNSSNASAGVTHDPAVDYTGSRSLFRGTCETLFVLDDDTKEVKGLPSTSASLTSTSVPESGISQSFFWNVSV